MACPHQPEDPCPACSATLTTAPPRGDDDTFIREGSAEVATEPGNAEALAPGAPVGRYVVLERLGQGGMGVLYTAHDPQLQRVVAIKLLRSAVGETGTSGQVRLLREAQAMAQLAHPNVVPVYDSGPWGDGVFIAMELVRGRSLDVWLRAEARPWREALRVYLAAGQGLIAAHAAGLVHRDFKPANVLMGDDGRPRVTDFGLARSTRTATSSSEALADPDPDSGERTPVGLASLDTPLTRAGSVMGSPGYMAPEQYVGGETSPATDQYAFCVSLYEALYGRRPFEADSLAGMTRLVLRGAVPPPPRGSKVPARLYRVLLRGLAPEPAQRFPSMSTLLEALVADPWVARRRWLAVAAGLGAGLLAVAAPAWTAHRQARACRGAAQKLEQVWDAAVQQRAETAFAATRLPFATATWARTRNSLDAWAAAWVQARTEACEATRVRGEESERQLALRFECLDRRLAEVGALAQAFAGADAALVTGATEAVSRLSPLGLCADVKALADRRRPPPEHAAEADALARQLAQAHALVGAGRLGEARALVEPAQARASSLSLTAVEAEAFTVLGELELEAHRFTDARAALEQGARAALVATDDRAAARALVGMVSLVGWRLERPDQARTLAALAGGLLERVGGDALLGAALEEGLGDAEWQAGDRPRALAAYRRALAGFERVQGQESVDVARLHSSVGWVLTEQGDLTAAREELERSRAVRERLLGPTHPVLAQAWNALANLALEQHDTEAAVHFAQRARAIHEQRADEASLVLQRARMNLALALATARRTQEAEALLQRVEPALRRMSDVPLAYWTEYHRVRALCLLGHGRTVEALQGARASLAENELLLGKAHPDLATPLLPIVLAELSLRRWSEAAASAERYFAARQKLGGVPTPQVGAVMMASAGALFALGRAEEAGERLEAGLATLRRGAAPASETVRIVVEVADTLWRDPKVQSQAHEVIARVRASVPAAEAGPLDAWVEAHPRPAAPHAR